MSEETPELPIIKDPQRGCLFCIHSKSITGSKTTYQCRYKPPTHLGFPVVKHHDWCRLYKPDPVKVEAWKTKRRKALAIEAALERKPK